MRWIIGAANRRPKLVLISSVLAFAISGVLGTAVIPRMSGGGYDDASSDSSIVQEVLEQDFAFTDPHLSIAVGVAGEPNSVESVDVVSVADDLYEQIMQVEGVESITTYWGDTQGGQLASADESLGLILVYVTPENLDQKNAISKKIIDQTPRQIGDVEIYIGGIGAIYTSINTQITEDIKFAEIISIPLTLILLLIVFGTAVAASMPLIVGFIAIAGAMFGIWIVSYMTDVSVFALNLITGLGLGLGIDYALLIVNRFREELAKHDVETAVARTIQTAGRTVLFSGLTVALTLSAMFVFPQQFLRSFAFAGVLVCLMAVVGALVPLPAALRLLGHRIDKGRVRKGELVPKEDGFWSKTAYAVMRKPITVSLVTIAILGAAASLVTEAKFGQVDDRVLPADNPAAISSQIFRDYFSSFEGSPIEILLPKNEDVNAYATELSQKSEIVRVEVESGIAQRGVLTPLDATTGWPFLQFSGTDYNLVRAIAEVEPRTVAGEDLIAEIRKLSDSALVGGSSAIYTDSQAGIADNMWNAIAWVAVATLILLFLFTGSVVLPLKAVLLNLLSLSATIGVVSWMFQNGNLQFLTGDYTVTGQLDTSTLVLILIVTFGLSMDYEVFLLSRIKEEHDEGASTEVAVARGLQKSGRIITAAALLLAVVFGAFVTSQVTSIKMLGFGIAFAILLDATVVRGLLVPALMRIAGKYNWWAPRSLVKVHAKFGLREN
jgi:putative drug exporter of the RND superfamily